MSQWLKHSMDELNRMDPEKYKRSDKLPVSVILDNVRSLMNVGSVFRTADAFRIQHVFLCGITGKPPHREIEKTALGATQSVDWSHHPSAKVLVEKCKLIQHKVYAVEQTKNSIALDRFFETTGYSITQNPITFIFGHEVEGVHQDLIDVCDGVIEIPQFGTKHSLNVAVSTGIVLWEIARKIYSKES